MTPQSALAGAGFCGGVSLSGRRKGERGRARTYRIGALEEVVGRVLLALEAAKSLDALIAAFETGRDNFHGLGGPLGEVVQEGNAGLVTLRGIGWNASSVEAVLAVE